MIYSLGGFQFVLLSMGLMVLDISLKSSSVRPATSLEHLIMDKGIFLLLLPVLWVVSATAVLEKKSSRLWYNLVRASGLLIAGAIATLFAILIRSTYG